MQSAVHMTIMSRICTNTHTRTHTYAENHRGADFTHEIDTEQCLTGSQSFSGSGWFKSRTLPEFYTFKLVGKKSCVPSRNVNIQMYLFLLSLSSESLLSPVLSCTCSSHFLQCFVLSIFTSLGFWKASVTSVFVLHK